MAAFEEGEYAGPPADATCRTLDPESVAAMTQTLHIWPLRAQECGATLVMLGTSQSLDPVGEVSPGAYWLAISTDRGQAWQEIYTGLRVYFPYVARAESDVPLLHDGKVLIHADLAELDVRSITFPPLGLEALREKENVVIAARLADLQRDTDRDGLADLVEARLLLDAENPDFDGDGILDGYDMQPNVPAGERTERGEAFALVLEEVFGYERAAIIPGMQGDRVAEQILQVVASGPPLRVSDTQFVVADPELLKGQLLPFRPIVLTREQAARLQDELGVFLPLELTDMFFSHDGNRAVLTWSAGWTGGTIYLERNASGQWQSEELVRWIT